MLELTYDKKVHLDKWDIDVIPYLTLNQIESIINDLITCNNGLERDLKLVADVIVACTNLYDNEDAKYDYEDILYSGFWYDLLDACPILVTNIETIYREVNDVLGLNRALIHFVDSLTHAVENIDISKFDLNNIDLEKISTLIKEVSDNVGEE